MLRRHVKMPLLQVLLANLHGHRFERLSVLKNLHQPEGDCLLRELMLVICHALRPKLLGTSRRHTKVKDSWKCRQVVAPNYCLCHPTAAPY